MSKASKRTGDAKAAVGYLRVSTDEQNLGPEAQRAAILAWALRNGVTVVAWCSDQRTPRPLHRDTSRAT